MSPDVFVVIIIKIQFVAPFQSFLLAPQSSALSRGAFRGLTQAFKLVYTEAFKQSVAVCGSGTMVPWYHGRPLVLVDH